MCRILLLLAVLAQVVAGCTSHFPCPVQGAKYPVHYLCEGGTLLSVSHFGPGGSTVQLGYEKRQYTLSREPSGSGIKYSDAGITWWSKGDEGILLVDDRILLRSCRVQR